MTLPARWLYAADAVADTCLAAAGRHGPRRVTKPLLMPLLMVARDRPSQRALGLSWAGDVALLARSDEAFTVGLGSFLAAQAAWIVALRGRPGRGALAQRPWLAVPTVAAWAGLNAVLWRRTGSDRVPVVIYSTVLAGMALVALDSGVGRTALGGQLFLASDALIALERFAGIHLPAHEGWVMASYVAAQALLAD